MDPATFLGAPFRPDALATNFADLDVALVGVPMDLGVTNRAGSRLGPRAVRGVERIGPYEHVLAIAPFGEARVADIGDVPMRSRFSLAECHADIEAHFGRIARPACARLRSAATTRSRLPILKALGRERPARHDPYRRPLRHVGRVRGVEVPPWRAVPAGGARGRARPGAHDPDRHPRRRRISVGVLLRERHDGAPCRGGRRARHPGGDRRGAPGRGRRADLPLLRHRHLDPGFAPGTGTPEVGGLTPREALQLLRG